MKIKAVFYCSCATKVEELSRCFTTKGCQEYLMESYSLKITHVELVQCIVQTLPVKFVDISSEKSDKIGIFNTNCLHQTPGKRIKVSY